MQQKMLSSIQNVMSVNFFRYHPFFRFSEFPNQKKVEVVIKVIGFHVLYLSS
jgi:hypothetical protein